MDLDKKHLALIGISVFALFIMGVGLAFRKEFKKMGEPQKQQHTSMVLSEQDFK